MPSENPPVIFDLDGVLLESEPRWTIVETELFRRYGITYGQEHKLQLVGTGLGGTGKQFEAMLDQPGRARELLEELIELAAEDFVKGLDPMPGAVELVEELHRLTRPMAIASNSFHRLVDVALDGSPLKGQFEVVVAADDVDHPKPAPDLFLEACSRLGVTPTDAIAIEDSAPGVASAKAAGLYVIGIPAVEGVELDDADLVAMSLASPEVREALGLAATSGS
ncbi:MAG: HAD family hydrolase [Actinomycetota bacterium]